MPNIRVSFHPLSCDPMGEGEDLARSIRRVHPDTSRAAAVLLDALHCLGVPLLCLDAEHDDDEALDQRLIELVPDTLSRLKAAIARADAWLAENPEPQLEEVPE
jgi:hypothetical protein